MRADTPPLSHPRHRNLKITISSIILKIFTAGFVMQTQGRREGTSSDFLLHSVRPFSRRFVVVIAWFSARCFTQPTYLRALTYSGCAAASIYTYHTDPRWVCHIRCFVFRLLSLRAVGLFGGRLSSLCALFWCLALLFFFLLNPFLYFFFCVSCSSIITSPPSTFSSHFSSAAGAPASLTLHKKGTTGQVMTLVK